MQNVKFYSRTLRDALARSGKEHVGQLSSIKAKLSHQLVGHMAAQDTIRHGHRLLNLREPACVVG